MLLRFPFKINYVGPDAVPGGIADLHLIVVYVCSAELRQDLIESFSGDREDFPSLYQPLWAWYRTRTQSGEPAHVSCYESEAKGLKASWRQRLDKELAKQPQFPQPLPISLVLQTLPQLRCPSLDTLQHLNVSLVVRGPKLNTAFKAAFQPLFPKPVALHGVVVTQVQDPALGLVEPHTTGLSPSIQPVQVPLQSLPTLQQINTPTQLGVLCKLTEGALDPFVQIIDKGIKQDWPQHRALGNTTGDRPPTGFNSVHHNSLGSAIQPDFYPAKRTPVQAMSCRLLQENALLINSDARSQKNEEFKEKMSPIVKMEKNRVLQTYSFVRVNLDTSKQFSSALYSPYKCTLHWKHANSRLSSNGKKANRSKLHLQIDALRDRLVSDILFPGAILDVIRQLCTPAFGHPTQEKNLFLSLQA
ncbi:hypothetical protein QYF61_026205 [Mycteria americana]|uniref:Uncharacterized protein n=1 Tax=Mycteria americana TaxID=33587 RepID=A0AAN7RT11_MYCAM|nr:hypothetical protein QYF61_026205 [Mycteria americana]